jgi:hypothetical protein
MPSRFAYISGYQHALLRPELQRALQSFGMLITIERAANEVCSCASNFLHWAVGSVDQEETLDLNGLVDQKERLDLNASSWNLQSLLITELRRHAEKLDALTRSVQDFVGRGGHSERAPAGTPPPPNRPRASAEPTSSIREQFPGRAERGANGHLPTSPRLNVQHSVHDRRVPEDFRPELSGARYWHRRA